MVQVGFWRRALLLGQLVPVFEARKGVGAEGSCSEGGKGVVQSIRLGSECEMTWTGYHEYFGHAHKMPKSVGSRPFTSVALASRAHQAYRSTQGI